MFGKLIVAAVCLGAMAAWGDGDTEKRFDTLESRFDRVMAKAGISFGGEFRSQYFLANVEGPAAVDSARKRETDEFTSVDFDIKARPNEAIGGRLIFRMHQNWQNFYSDISNPIFSRWISLDGEAREMFSYHAGDFRTQYSPLTLYSPDIDILFEPEIFARSRTIAMSEEFLGGRDRLLQGLGVSFDAEVVPILNELHANVLGVRLRNTLTNFQNGSMVTHFYESDDPDPARSMEKLAMGVNLDTRFLEGASLGGTFILIGDHKGSYRGSDTVADTLAQRTFVGAARPAIDLAPILGLDGWRLELGAEVALSGDDSAWYDVTVDTVVGTAGDTSYRTTQDLVTDRIRGTALRAGPRLKMILGSAGHIGLDASFVRNEESFRNELAQSPSFFPTRIMNVENDMIGGRGTGHVHYSTFDALYHSVFKFAPSDSTNMWHKSPFRKISYTRSIAEQEDLERIRLSGALDPSVQLVMPFGPATPNRQGVDVDLTAEFLGDGIGVRAKLAAFGEIEGAGGLASLERAIDSLTDTTVDTILAFPITSFAQYGGGLRVDLASLVLKRLPHPLVLSGSFLRSTASNPGTDYAGSLTAWSLTSDFVNLGLYYKFWKRAALLGGLQFIATNAEKGGVPHEQTQTHWAAGTEWTVGRAADIVFTVGQIIVDNKDNGGLSLSSAGVTTDDFRQMLLDLSLRVRF